MLVWVSGRRRTDRRRACGPVLSFPYLATWRRSVCWCSPARTPLTPVPVRRSRSSSVPDNGTAAVTDDFSAPENANPAGIAATAILRSFSANLAGSRCRLRVAASAFVLFSPVLFSPVLFSLAIFGITAAHSACVASIDRAERRDAATRTRPDGLPVIGATLRVHGRRIGGRGALDDAASLAAS